MAPPSTECTEKEQWSVIQCLWSKGVSTKQIDGGMTVQYGNRCIYVMSRKKVYEWVGRFTRGWRGVDDVVSGWPSTTRSGDAKEQSVQYIQDSWRIGFALGNKL